MKLHFKLRPKNLEYLEEVYLALNFLNRNFKNQILFPIKCST